MVVVVHDVGKIALGFQAMLRGGPRFVHRHEVLSLVVVGALDLPEDQRALVAAGVVTHHRDWSAIRQAYMHRGERDALLAEMSTTDEAALRRWLGGDGVPDLEARGFHRLPNLRDRAPADALVDALRAVAALNDEIERVTSVHTRALSARFIRGLVLLADHAASAHEALPAPPGSLASPERFRAVVSILGDNISHHQARAAEVVGHCLLTAPTGSGKTEAALLWAARQRESAATPPAVFYVLPFRASINAMRARMRERYALSDRDVVLQHSSSTTALYSYLLEGKGYTREAARAVAIRNRALGRLMTAPVRVLTPYQLLRGFFGLRGHEAILTDAAGGVFVLDELHAYDPERLALILAAVHHLAVELRARFLAMSATFPRVLHVLLEEVLAPATVVTADESTRKRAVRHVLRIADRTLLDPDSLAEIARRQRLGEAVLVVTTTVARAQELYSALRAVAGAAAVSLLHGRFTASDRARKETLLLARVANGRVRQGGPGTILVATQVVEVSLDVDFDVLFTDPAPVESLVQRFGRVNRAARSSLSDVVVHTAIPDASDRIYDHNSVVRTLDTLRPFADSPIDECDVQAWVDAGYETMADSFLSYVRRRMREYRQAVIETNRPLESHPELRALFDAQFDGTDVVPLSLRADYERLCMEYPLAAPGFRVPVSLGQRAGLVRSGRIVRGEDVEYADCPYDPDRGLDLTFRSDDDA